MKRRRTGTAIRQKKRRPQRSDFNRQRDSTVCLNPAELFEMEGEELWTAARGPNRHVMAYLFDPASPVNK